jgi:hypothetical protein
MHRLSIDQIVEYTLLRHDSTCTLCTYATYLHFCSGGDLPLDSTLSERDFITCMWLRCTTDLAGNRHGPTAVAREPDITLGSILAQLIGLNYQAIIDLRCYCVDILSCMCCLPWMLCAEPAPCLPRVPVSPDQVPRIHKSMLCK